MIVALDDNRQIMSVHRTETAARRVHASYLRYAEYGEIDRDDPQERNMNDLGEIIQRRTRTGRWMVVSWGNCCAYSTLSTSTQM